MNRSGRVALLCLLVAASGGGEVVDVTCDRDRSQCSARVHDGGQERTVGVLVGLDDSDDFSIVTTFER